MKIKIIGKELEITEAINSYVERKLERIEKYFKDVESEAEVTLKTEKNAQIAEIFVKADVEKYRAVTEDKDLYASIDNDIDILEGQIRKAKTKKDKMMKESSLKSMDFVDKKEIEIKDEILKSMYYDIKPMTSEDAIIKLKERKSHTFFTFINVETNKVNVIYKLKDGNNYGIVEPEA